MRAALQLCREYGQAPEWWHGLDSGEQALLLADLQLRESA